MILDTKEAKCVLGVLRKLSSGIGKYSEMFRETKVSHTTLQSVLKELEAKKFIKKHDKGHMDVDYEITEKGKRMLESLNETTSLLK